MYIVFLQPTKNLFKTVQCMQRIIDIIMLLSPPPPKICSIGWSNTLPDISKARQRSKGTLSESKQK